MTLKTHDQLTACLAVRVLHWRVTPDRFLTGKRGWLPRWKFQPVQKLADAIRLMEAANPEEYSLSAGAKGGFCARVIISGTTAEAHANTKPLAICLAVSAALGIEVEQRSPAPAKGGKR
jgi:hypothetical protein